MMVMAGIAVAGALISAYGAAKSADAQAAAAKAQAKAMRAQARMVMKRAEINKGRMRVEGKAFSEKQVSSFAGSGVDITSGSVLATMNQTVNAVESGIQDMMADAEYEAAVIRSGAQVATQQGRDIKQAGQWQAAGSLVSGAGQASQYF